jgi:2-keto-3-deoxy-L-rhamnonate aldolase RhmA
MCVMVQIESNAGVAAARMGHLGNASHPEVQVAIASIFVATNIGINFINSSASRHCEQSEAIHDFRVYGAPRFARDDGSRSVCGIRPDTAGSQGHQFSHQLE